MDVGLLLLRLIVGLLIAGHGAQKVSHLFGGDGLACATEEFRREGFRGGALTAIVAGGSQIGSGLFLTAGLLTPLATMAAMGVMTVAVTVKLPHGLWVQHNGYEYPLVLFAAGAALALTGPGRWSVDNALDITEGPVWVAVAAITAGAGTGLLTRVLLHRPVAAAEGARYAQAAD